MKREQGLVTSDKIILGLTQEQAHQLLIVLQELHSYHNALAEVYEVLKVKVEKGPRQDHINLLRPSKRPPQ